MACVFCLQELESIWMKMCDSYHTLSPFTSVFIGLHGLFPPECLGVLKRFKVHTKCLMMRFLSNKKLTVEKPEW